MRNLQDLYTDIGRKIRKMRNDRGWSQEELANKADTGLTYISEIENGKGSPGIEILWRIASAFGVDVKELLEP